MAITLIVKSPHDPVSQACLKNLQSVEPIKDLRYWDEGKSLSGLIEELGTEFFLLLIPQGILRIETNSLNELISIAKKEGAGMVYSDYSVNGKHKRLCDYRPGSLRDDFDFGSLVLLSTEKAKETLRIHPPKAPFRFGEFYDLRLKMSRRYKIIHHRSPSYEMVSLKYWDPKEAMFSYVDPRNLEYQKEMESIFTDHLQSIGAYIPPDLLRPAYEDEAELSASIIVPVKNRETTIEDALLSAVTQKTDFPFNVLVIDNYSSDRTGEIVSEMARKYPNIIRIVPKRKGLGIGGCWNEALSSPFCGRYLVQLDSDDLYSREDALEILVDTLRKGKYAMVVGSYMTVDFDLNPVYPGIVDHREWSEKNGHNNLLRVSGIGAPRAFDRRLLMEIPFRDLSYGEDYELSLRISREYRIGRIYDVLYLARRWEGGTDHSIDEERLREFNELKDSMRTEELKERIEHLKRFF